MNVAADDNCEADECERSVSEGEGGGIREVFKTVVDKEERVMYADTGYDGNGFEEEEIVNEEDIKATIGAKVPFCGDGVQRKD